MRDLQAWDWELRQIKKALDAERRPHVRAELLSRWQEIRERLIAFDDGALEIEPRDPLVSVLEKLQPAKTGDAARDRLKWEQSPIGSRQTDLGDLARQVRDLEHKLSGEKLDPNLPTAGAHRDLPTQGGERHHMPAWDAIETAKMLNPDLPKKNPLLTYGGAGAMRLDTIDHYETASHGSGNAPKPGVGLNPAGFRAEQATLIAEGKYLDAIALDINNDIRRDPQLGPKYEKHVQRFLDFLQDNSAYVQELNKNSQLTIEQLRTPPP